jgi:CRP/FNR family transcriptional regulator, cyclic AMP receptor protein
MPMSLRESPIESRSSRPKPRALPDFLNLTNKALERFDNIAQQIARTAGSVLFKEGDPADGIYVVRAGEVKLFASSTDGRSIVFKIARLGDVLGLSAALTEMPYEVTAETLCPCNLKHINQHAFLGFVKSHAEAGCAAAVTLAREHREVVLRAPRFALSISAPARIARVLLEFVKPNASAQSTRTFSMVLTHSELANLAGTSRETVTRFLNQLERDGIIARQDSSVTLLERSRLEKLAR